MDSRRDSSYHTAQGIIRVVLEGGPADLPAEMSLQRNALDKSKIKLPRHGGYEHFELVNDDWRETSSSPVFRWIMRTKVAE